MGSLITSAKGTVHIVKEMGIKSMLVKIGRVVAVASVLLGAVLVCVLGVFVAAGIVVLPPIAFQTCIACLKPFIPDNHSVLDMLEMQGQMSDL